MCIRDSSQFASDLDAKTRAQLERGARLVEVLKQGQFVPMDVARQVVIIFASTRGYIDALPVEVLGRYEEELFSFLDTKYPDLAGEFAAKGKPKDKDNDFTKKLTKALDEFANIFVASESDESEEDAEDEEYDEEEYDEEEDEEYDDEDEDEEDED